MYEEVEKPKENKGRAVAHSVAQKKGNAKQGFGFVDNRSESDRFSNLQMNIRQQKSLSTIQRLEGSQKNFKNSFKLDDKFKTDHVLDAANRKDMEDVAKRRGITNSTLITHSAKYIEEKAQGILDGGGNESVTAGKFNNTSQISIKIRGLNHRTITKSVLQEPSNGAFVIAGPWVKGKGQENNKVLGHHYDASGTLKKNDDETSPL